jgi:hypothetical protein
LLAEWLSQRVASVLNKQVQMPTSVTVSVTKRESEGDRPGIIERSVFVIEQCVSVNPWSVVHLGMLR